MIKVIFKVEVSRRPNERPTPSPKSNCMDRPGSTKLSKYVREKCSFPDYPSFILLGPTKTPHVAFLPFFCQNPSPSCSISRRGWKFRTGSLSIKIGWCPLFNLTLCMSTPPCKRTVHAKDMLNDWCVVLPGISWTAEGYCEAKLTGHWRLCRNRPRITNVSPVHNIREWGRDWSHAEKKEQV